MAPSVRVLSYNIRKGIGMDGRMDLARTADVVRETGADVVGLQEVDRHFRTGTEYADQFGALREHLDMDGVYAPAIERDPVDESDGKPRQYGVAVLSRYPILSSRSYDLTRDTDAEPRVLLDTTVDCDGVPLSFATAHLGLSESVRRKQVTDAIDETDADRQVLVGDFNAAPDSATVETLGGQFVDAFGDRDPGDRLTFPSPYDEDGERTGEPERCIDYVFCTSDLDVRSANVVESPASDHSAVAASFELDARDA